MDEVMTAVIVDLPLTSRIELPLGAYACVGTDEFNATTGKLLVGAIAGAPAGYRRCCYIVDPRDAANVREGFSVWLGSGARVFTQVVRMRQPLTTSA